MIAFLFISMLWKRSLRNSEDSFFLQAEETAPDSDQQAPFLHPKKINFPDTQQSFFLRNKGREGS